MILNVQQAKAQLSRMVDAAMQGEEVVIAKAGKPCVRLVPVTLPPRIPGAAKGRATLTPVFFEPLPEHQLRRWERG